LLLCVQVGYVEQMDIHSSSATVEEALWFSGRLRLPPSVSNAQVGLLLLPVLLCSTATFMIGHAGTAEAWQQRL
jgi:hypothetical protein